MRNIIILYFIIFLVATCSNTGPDSVPDEDSTNISEPIWESFEAPFQNIRTIEVDSNDNLIVGTENEGVHIMIGDQWTSYTVADGLFNDDIQCIAVDQNNLIYIGHNFSRDEVGISIFNGTQWSILSFVDTIRTYPFIDVHSITFDDGNIPWVAFHGGQILYYDGHTWYDTDNNSKTFGTGTQGKIAFDNNGVLWGNGEDTSFKLDGQVWEQLLYDGQLLDSYTLTIDQDDLVWFGSWRKGIFVYNGLEIQHFSVENSPLPSNRIHYIITDKKNAKWIATDSGLTKYDGLTWQTIALSDSTIPYVGRYLAVDSQNSIWIADITNKITVYRGDQINL